MGGHHLRLAEAQPPALLRRSRLGRRPRLRRRRLPRRRLLPPQLGLGRLVGRLLLAHRPRPRLPGHRRRLRRVQPRTERHRGPRARVQGRTAIPRHLIPLALHHGPVRHQPKAHRLRRQLRLRHHTARRLRLPPRRRQRQELRVLRHLHHLPQAQVRLQLQHLHHLRRHRKGHLHHSAHQQAHAQGRLEDRHRRPDAAVGARPLQDRGHRHVRLPGRQRPHLPLRLGLRPHHAPLLRQQLRLHRRLHQHRHRRVLQGHLLRLVRRQ